MGLYARKAEEMGITTVMVTLIPEIGERLKIPRTLYVPFRLGRPCGEPFDLETRRKVVEKMLILALSPSGTHGTY
ncbi:hypothetical protein [Piscibacillus halophilus]|uniref:Glycine reductase n=1 Tax=Piscibacillus halophilus TaxID=571933 RepID=A0A1H9CGN1_9BACI|nr:hypothetical protein [Piscibacillus halophilus]SEP99778.1 hypothetical protein SAMN05216362_10550 [Piscibacillus halophilus]